MIKTAVAITYKTAKRIVIFAIGATVVIIGIIMLVTPGPAFVFIPLGLAILSVEFAWARRWLGHIRERINTTANAGRRLTAGKRRSEGNDPETGSGAEQGPRA